MATVQVAGERTLVQRAALIFGWAFVGVGVLGFLVTGASMEDDPLLAPRLLGLFPLNVMHNVVHLLLGVWGIASAGSFAASKSYAVGAGTIYLLLAVLGVFSPSMFGMVPIGGNDIWLHLLFGLPLLAVGLMAKRPEVIVADRDADGATMP
ncbi:MAG TPA: DUF4383 domain-containing protein [Gemmatimonadaceae bacterium]